MINVIKQTNEIVAFGIKGDKLHVGKIVALLFMDVLGHITVTTLALAEGLFLNKIIDIEDGSEDNVINTSGYGFEQLVSKGKYKWTFRIHDGGLALNKMLHRAEFASKGVFLIDDKMRLIGCTYNDDGTMRPFTVSSFMAKKAAVATGEAPMMYKVDLTLANPDELNKNFAIWQLEETDLATFSELKLYAERILVGKTLSSVIVNLSSGGVILGELYYNANDFKLYNALTGAAVTVTSAVQALNGNIQIGHTAQTAGVRLVLEPSAGAIVLFDPLEWVV